MRCGQVLCESGDIGFSPEPHLHVELHSSEDPEGPSLPFSFNGVIPVAGCWYSSCCEVPAPEKGPRARHGALEVKGETQRNPKEAYSSVSV